MHKLLNLQLKKVYGKEFDLMQQDEKFIKFISLVESAYTDYEDEEKFLEHTLNINAKELEESNCLLYQKQELLKSVENSLDYAIFYKDLEHKYIGCNLAFSNFFGLSEEEMIGKSDFDFFTTSIAEQYYVTNEDIMKNKTKVVYKHWVQLENKKIYALTSKTPLVNRQGQVIGIVGTSRDITHEFRLQKDLEQKNIMLIQQNKLASMGEMIANIAHQWRQPLNTLGLLIQKIGVFYKQNLLDEKKMDEYISEAIYLTQDMSQTIDDFRNFFSPNKVLEDFNINESIQKSYIIIKQDLKNHNINFIIDIDNDYFIYGYKNEFFQVILNLLNNAVEALILDEIISPKINVSVRNRDHYITVTVCDNAHGIRSSVITKIFDPYFTTKETGTGLGLYMSKIIIEEHMKGKLSVKSSHFGSTFTILLEQKNH